jgi:hypothetical protein
MLIDGFPATDMQTNRYKYFRWTPRTARIAFTWVFVVPAIVGYMSYKTDVSIPRSYQDQMVRN